MATEWTEKWMREGWAMPFGSMCNAYAQMHQQKPLPIDEFAQDALKLYILSRKLIADSIIESSGEVQNEEILKVKDWLRKIENK